MAGLFDNLFGNAGGMYADMLSPEQQAAIRKQSMMQVAAKLLEGSGPSPVRRTLGQTLGGALSAGAEAVQTGQANAVQQMLMRQKIQDTKDEQARKAKYMEMLGSTENAGGVFGNLSEQQRAILASMPMEAGMKFMLDQSIPKEDPASIKEYNFAVGQGYKGSFTDFVNMKTPNTRVVLPAGPNQFVSGAGTGASNMLIDATKAAQAANQTLQTVDRIAPALDSAILGPAADYRTAMMRVADQLGVAGEDAQTKLQNTRQVVQGLAQSELDAASAMRGQGQITEGERALLRRTAAGDQSMTAAEIRTSMAAMQKLANQRIAEQQGLYQQSLGIQGFSEIAPMFRVTPYQPQFNLQNNLNLGNAVQQELDRRRQSGGAR